MTVRELIRQLLEFDLEADVMTLDGVRQGWEDCDHPDLVAVYKKPTEAVWHRGDKTTNRLPLGTQFKKAVLL